MPTAKVRCHVLLLAVAACYLLVAPVSSFNGYSMGRGSVAGANCGLGRWNRGAWEGDRWVPASFTTKDCALPSKDDLSYIRDATLVILGDIQGALYTHSMQRQLEACRLVKEGKLCEEAESFLGLHSLSYFSKEGCASSNTCVSQEYVCGGGIRLIFVPVEHPWDFRISSAEYPSTQQAVITGYLKHLQPDAVLFNTGLRNIVNYPRAQPVAIPADKSSAGVGRNASELQELLRSKTRSSWESGESAAFYQAGLRQYVELLRDTLNSTLLVWARTTAPKSETWNESWNLAGADQALVREISHI